ncbi:MAG: hypothetical protein WCH34_15975 [Bacteroidota bacterium]
MISGRSTFERNDYELNLKTYDWAFRDIDNRNYVIDRKNCVIDRRNCVIEREICIIDQRFCIIDNRNRDID